MFSRIARPRTAGLVYLALFLAVALLGSACSVSLDVDRLESVRGGDLDASTVDTEIAMWPDGMPRDTAAVPTATPTDGSDVVSTDDPAHVDHERGTRDEGSIRSSEPDEDPLSRSVTEPTPTAVPTPTPEPLQDDNPFSDPIDGGGIDFRLTRNDIECDGDDLNGYQDTLFLVAHVVVDGNLGEACYGSPDPRLTEAWQILAAITPPGQLHDIGLFGGYVSTEKGETTLAFVNTLDLEGSVFQMSINLDEAEADVDELRLTMAHEFSHVFTSLPSQLDRFILPDECTTWDSGEGCFREDSLMWEWIQIFWADGLIDEIDPFNNPTSAGGADRCDRNNGFLGPYSASNPEEDFAESFSAFVFQLDVPSERLRTKMAWFAGQPGLLEFQELAIEAGFGPQKNYFPRCG